MPYIDDELKQKLNPLHPDWKAGRIDSAGELTYLLTLPAIAYLSQHKLKFLTICIIMGSFFCAALEFYRRVAVPFEEGKKRLNGDVYPLRLAW